MSESSRLKAKATTKVAPASYVLTRAISGGGVIIFGSCVGGDFEVPREFETKTGFCSTKFE